jgi:hypothetical protein
VRSLLANTINKLDKLDERLIAYSDLVCWRSRSVSFCDSTHLGIALSYNCQIILMAGYAVLAEVCATSHRRRFQECVNRQEN